MKTELTSKAARYLRGLGHGLSPVIHVGKEGVTDGLVGATNAVLLAHELVKVRVQQEAPVDRKETAEDLASKTESALAQVLGRTFLLYKKHPKKPKIQLPE
jgi:RNA-binding protein